METENQKMREQESSDQAEIVDNLALLEQHLPDNSFALELVRAYRDSDDSSSALTEMIDQRLENLREKHATPVFQDD